METELQKAIYMLYLAPRTKRLRIGWEYRYNEIAMDMLMSEEHLARVKEWRRSPWRITQWEVWYEEDHVYREEVSDCQTGFLVFNDGRTLEYLINETNEPQVHLRPEKPRIEDWIARHTLLRPRCLLVSHEMTWRNIEVKLGRTVFHVEAKNVGHGIDDICCFDEWFWGGAEKYHLWIDKETGILLQYTAEVYETTIAVAEVKDVEIDFSGDIFPIDIATVNRGVENGT